MHLNDLPLIPTLYLRLFSLVKEAGRRITQQQLSSLDEPPHAGTDGRSPAVPRRRPQPINKSIISHPRRPSMRFSLRRASTMVDNSSSIVTLRGTEKDTPRAVRLFRRYLATLKEDDEFDEEKTVDWENITAASGSVHY